MAPAGRLGCAAGLAGLLITLTACQVEPETQGEELEPAQAEVHNEAALDPWLETAAAAQDERADVLLIGDSVLEGLGAEWEGRPATLLQDRLREDFPIEAAQGAGYLPAMNFAAIVPPWVTQGGGLPLASFGLGFKALGLEAGQTLTHRGDFRRLRLWFGVEPGESAPGLVSIDGAPPEEISRIEDRTGSGLQWDSGDLGAGVHEVTVTGADGGLPFVLEAIEELGSEDDLERGVHVYDGAHSGFDSRAFLNDLPAVRHMWEAAGAVSPDVTVIQLGINDRSVNVSAQQLADNITAIADRAATAAADEDHPVLVMVPYRIPRVSDVAGKDPLWDEIRAALIALAEDNIAVLDLGASWPDLALGRGAESGVMLEDELPVHPNSVGRKRLAALVADALSGD